MTASAQLFEALRHPGHEDWRYTRLDDAIRIGQSWLDAGAPALDAFDDPIDISALTDGIEADWLVISNGHVRVNQLDAIDGLTVAISNQPPGPLRDLPLHALSQSLLVDGVRVSVERSLTRPIGLLIADTLNDVLAQVSQTSIAIDVADGCSADIVELHHSAGNDEHFSNAIFSLRLGNGANVNYLRSQDRAESDVHTESLIADLASNAHFSMSNFDLGARLARNDFVINMNGVDAIASLDGLYLTRGEQHVDNHTAVNHHVGPAESSQHFRGILSDKSRAVWNGKAVVAEGADGTDASQSNHNLLLTPHAEINAKPELEIYAEDVKCNHGTTVGQLDEAATYYLRSRGLDLNDARQLLTQAFARTIVDQIAIDAFRPFVESRVEKRLRKMISEAWS